MLVCREASCPVVASPEDGAACGTGAPPTSAGDLASTLQPDLLAACNVAPRPRSRCRKTPPAVIETKDVCVGHAMSGRTVMGPEARGGPHPRQREECK